MLIFQNQSTKIENWVLFFSEYFSHIKVLLTSSKRLLLVILKLSQYFSIFDKYLLLNIVIGIDIINKIIIRHKMQYLIK